MGKQRRAATGFAFTLALVLLAWMPALLHDVAGDPSFSRVLSTPALARAAGIFAGIWLILGAVVAGTSTLLARGSKVPGLGAGIALAGSTVALLARQWAQESLAESAFSTEVRALFLVAGATVGVGIVLRALTLVPLASRERSRWALALAILSLAALAVRLWQELGDESYGLWPLIFAMPLVGALVLLSVASGVLAARSGLIAATILAALSPLLALGWSDGHRSPAAPRKRAAANAPNVVVFMIDTLRADHTGLGGYGRDTTPHIDAATTLRATVFSQALANAPFTKPSVTALFTSRLADPVKLSPEPDAWTMARAFWEAGYDTGAFSSNHVISGEGYDNGFRTFFSLSVLRFLQRSFLVKELLAGGRMVEVFRFADRLHAYKIPGPQLTRAALSWIDRVEKRPFFAYVHSIDPHWPYRDHGYGMLSPELRDLENPISLTELLRIQKRDPHQMALRQSPRLLELLARYDEEVRHADRAIGELLEGLRERGLRRRTLLVIVGDHGEEFFERGGLGHGKDIDEFMIHVPLAILWPEGRRFGDLPARIEQPVTLLDVLPTLTDYLKLAAPPETVLGRSLRPLLEGSDEAKTGPLVAESLKGDIISATYREGSIKVRVVFPDQDRRLEEGRIELFDLERDPGELQPFEPGSEYAPLVARARLVLEELWAERRSGDQVPVEMEPVPGEDEAIQRLRALGYLN